MSEEQLDLFAEAQPSRQGAAGAAPASPLPEDPSDEEIVAILSSRTAEITISDTLALIRMAGQRRLQDAVPALVGICRRFRGFGARTEVPEQVAALRALAAIGGRAAARSVAEMIESGAFLGPTLRHGLAAAAALGSHIAGESLEALSTHDDPAIRLAACRSFRAAHAPAPALLELMESLDREMRNAAACALGRTGAPRARPRLLELLRTDPSLEAIAAIAGIADEDSVVVLGRIARSQPHLAAAAREALEDIDTPLARRILRHPGT